MIIVEELIKTKTKIERQEHVDLTESCIERGGNSTNHKGVLAQYLNSSIPYGIYFPLCHACNNGKCSNPKHLYWGTPRENIDDAIVAGTKQSPFKGIKLGPRSEKTKKKISNSTKGKTNNPRGINGSNTGKIIKRYTYKRKYKQMWITNNINNTRIPVDHQIPDGWFKGRTISS